MISFVVCRNVMCWLLIMGHLLLWCVIWKDTAHCQTYRCLWSSSTWRRRLPPFPKHKTQWGLRCEKEKGNMTMYIHMAVCIGQGTMPPRTNFSVVMEGGSVDNYSLNYTVYHFIWCIRLLRLLRWFDLSWKSWLHITMEDLFGWFSYFWAA